MELDFYDSEEFMLKTNRRDFLKIIGGGIVVFFAVEDAAEAQQRGDRRLPEDVNAFLKIGEDGRVACTTGKIEMGQGIITSLAQMLADELDVSLDSVDMIMGDTDLCPWDSGTHGSRSIRFFGPPLRAAAAEARSILLEMAAEHLKISRDRLKTQNGVVYDAANDQTKVTYAQLTKGKKIVKRLDQTAVQKTASQFKIIGTPQRKTNAEELVTGKGKFAGDIQFPGMLYARILRPPSHLAILKSVDVSAAEKMEGVRVLREDDFIAVLAGSPDRADAALREIKAEYGAPDANLDDENIFDHLLKNASGGNPSDQGGDLAEGEKNSAEIIEKTYLNSYVAHAPLEPHVTTVCVEGDRITFWSSTQSPFRLKDAVVDILNAPADQVRVITPYVGSGFGGKRSRNAIEAAKILKLAGKSVSSFQLAGTREEEFFYDTFRPAAIVKIRAGINDKGRISFWDYGVYYAGQRGANQFYDIPHHKTAVYGRGDAHPFDTGAWRAPANNTNTFARESHIDLLASAAGIDPLEFRFMNLKDERMIRVLKAAADQFNWTPAKSPSGRGYGISLGIDSGTYVAHMAEVKVDKESGEVQVVRVVCAQDMGLSINPEGARMQIEGCITMGLGYALTEEIHFRNGEIFDLNFNSYEIPRFSWLPKIETVIIDDKDAPAQGGGEPAIICMGAVISNAIYDATGARVLQLPMTPERIQKTMSL